jgi:UDP-N-acetylmuramate dehydrogenase
MTSATTCASTPERSLARWTTLGVGGPAEVFVEVGDVGSVAEALRIAEVAGSPVLVLGGGSNVVVADDGFPGTVIRIGIKGVEFGRSGDYVLARVGAGEDWGKFVSYCVTEGLSGTECLSGIPGSAGATPVQNVGAYGQEVSDTVVSVTVWDREAGAAVQLAPADCSFAYRDSIFKHSSRYVVTEVHFRLARSSLSQPVRYRELAERLGCEPGQRARLDETAEAVIALRRGKGMLLDPDDPDSRSVGSFFTNPLLDTDQLTQLLQLAPAVPRFPAPGGTKVPAAWLVERAGFARGYRKGRAAISSKHTLALTVGEGGTAADVLALAREVRDQVRTCFGVLLEPEPVIVGAHL